MAPRRGSKAALACHNYKEYPRYFRPKKWMGLDFHAVHHQIHGMSDFFPEISSLWVPQGAL